MTVAKRLIDVMVAFSGLVLLSPLLLATAVAVALSGRGPVFFRQIRVGKGHRNFWIVKFRTMVRDAPEQGPAFTLGGDPRITRVGHFLRRYKLDELPQLFNVLVGDMSLVGPRPQVPEVIAWLDEAQQATLLSVRPGITDYASVVFIDEASLLAESPDPERTHREVILPRKVALSLFYLDRRSLIEDLRIVLATIYLAFQGIVGQASRQMQVLVDVMLFAAAFLLAFAIRFEFDVPPHRAEQMVQLLPYTVLVRLLMNFAFGVYKVLWRYISLFDAARFVKSVGVVTAGFLFFRLVPIQGAAFLQLPISVILLEGLMSLCLVLGVRGLQRWVHEATHEGVVPVRNDVTRVLIVGAGYTGRAVAREIRVRSNLNMHLVGFLDDDPEKRLAEVEGARVLGTTGAIDEIGRREGVARVFLAITGLAPERKAAIESACEGMGARLQVIPGLPELIEGG